MIKMSNLIKTYIKNVGNFFKYLLYGILLFSLVFVPLLLIAILCAKSYLNSWLFIPYILYIIFLYTLENIEVEK